MSDQFPKYLASIAVRDVGRSWSCVFVVLWHDELYILLKLKISFLTSNSLLLQEISFSLQTNSLSVMPNSKYQSLCTWERSDLGTASQHMEQPPGNHFWRVRVMSLPEYRSIFVSYSVLKFYTYFILVWWTILLACQSACQSANM